MKELRLSKFRFSLKFMFALCTAIFVFTCLFVKPEQMPWTPFDFGVVEEKLFHESKVIIFLEDTSEVPVSGPAAKEFIDIKKLSGFANSKGFMLFYLDLGEKKITKDYFCNRLKITSHVEKPCFIVFRGSRSLPEPVLTCYAEDVINFVNKDAGKNKESEAKN